MFSMQSVSLSPLIATFQLSSAALMNLGQSQNSVLGNGLTDVPIWGSSNSAANKDMMSKIWPNWDTII